jgi:arylsulfatase A-like enzyme
MVADDLGCSDLGCMGAQDLRTPHLDSLAAGGVRFTSGYVSAPVCSPSRAGLNTGRYQTRFGHEFNHELADRSPDGVGLPLGEKTAAQWLKESGYATGHVGKWHLGNPSFNHYTPNARGFAESFHFAGAKKLPPLLYNHNREPGKAADRYVDEAMAREAAGFITRHRAEPWFLYVAFLTPHEPLQTPPGADDAFASISDPKRRTFATMMSLLDGSVGRILGALRETGQERRTLITFVSDNGPTPSNGSRATPLSGTKNTTWEGGLRVPFLMQWTDGLPAGRVVSEPVITLDVLPTALAAAGVSAPAGARFDGVNLLPFLTGKTAQPPHEALFWRYGSQRAVRAGDWKLVTANRFGAHDQTALTRLVNLARDPAEEHDLSKAEPAKLRELQALWTAWNAENSPALWPNGSAAQEKAPRR